MTSWNWNAVGSYKNVNLHYGEAMIRVHKVSRSFESSHTKQGRVTKKYTQSCGGDGVGWKGGGSTDKQESFKIVQNVYSTI